MKCLIRVFAILGFFVLSLVPQSFAAISIKYHYPQQPEYEQTQMFVAGRPIAIVNDQDFPSVPADQVVVGLSGPNQYYKRLAVSYYNLSTLITKLPQDLLSGTYLVKVSYGALSFDKNILVEGNNTAGGGVVLAIVNPDPAVGQPVNLNCFVSNQGNSGEPGFIPGMEEGCFWDAQIKGNPDNPQQLIVVGTPSDSPDFEHRYDYLERLRSNIMRSTRDGGTIWQTVKLAIPNQANIDFSDSPQAYVKNTGDVTVASRIINHQDVGGSPHLGVGGGLYSGNIIENVLNGHSFVNIPSQASRSSIEPPVVMANDTANNWVYLTGRSVVLKDTNPNDRHNALLVSKDGGASFDAPQSIVFPGKDIWAVRDLALETVNGVSELRGVFLVLSDNNITDAQMVLMLYDSQAKNWTFHPGFFMKLAHNVSSFAGIPLAKIPTIGLAWQVWPGPVMAIDNSRTPARIYVVYAEPESIVVGDAEFELGVSSRYGVNYDLFLRYSDDDGAGWSAPLKLNDDVPVEGAPPADSVFPSVAINQQGQLDISFVDTREATSPATFNFYYTKVKEITTGTGEKKLIATKNIRVNTEGIPNNGGQSLGFHSRNIYGYKDKAYIVYPCSIPRNPPAPPDPRDACVVSIDRTKADPPSFRRGYINADDKIDLSDVIYLLEYLFLGGPQPVCQDGTLLENDAADVNDDGSVDIADAIYLLIYLFGGGADPKFPFPDPGPDPTPDDIPSCP